MQMTNEEIAEQVRVYDCERSRGIVHDRSYSIKMEQYRNTLQLDANMATLRLDTSITT